jgi:glucose-1-phosphate thymidylyltransferase
MYPLTRDFPKPLLPVAGKPVLDYIMEQLVDLRDLRGIHVVTNAKFFAVFNSWRRGWSRVLKPKKVGIAVHNDGSTTNENRLGPAADLQFVLQRIPEPSRILVAAGDNIFRFSLEPLWERFLNSDHHYIMTLRETDTDKLKKTGVPILSKDDRVLRLFEKPQQPPSSWACPLLHFFQATVWPRLDEFISTAKKRSDKDYFIDFLCQKENLYAFKLNAPRLNIGSIESYHEAQACLSKEPLYPKEFADKSKI